MTGVRWGVFLALLLILSLASRVHAQRPAANGYAPAVHGVVAGFRLAGVEPDGDPLDQVALRTTLSPSAGTPGLTLIVQSYLENFKPDTTPILPDLLHPGRTAQNLAGFLQGKALLTDNAGAVLYIGSFLAEAFLDNSNHAVLRLDGTGAARKAGVALQGTFTLVKDGSLHGVFTGHISLPAAAARQVAAHHGAKLPPLTQILKLVTVHPAPMLGRNTQPSPSAPLKTGFGTGSGGGRRISPLSIAAGIGALTCLAIAAFLWWTGRRPAESGAHGA